MQFRYIFILHFLSSVSIILIQGVVYIYNFRESSKLVANWITTEDLESPIFRKTFTIEEFSECSLYVSGLGYQLIYINGELVTDRVLDPVFSDYEEREFKNLEYPLNDSFSYSTYYVVYDVTKFLVHGLNCICVWLGNGWYNQKLRKVEGELHYGKPKLFAQLEINNQENVKTIISDTSWKYFSSPIVSNNIFSGEIYDARLECRDFSKVSSIINNTKNAILAKPTETIMREQKCPADKVIKNITPIIIKSSENYKLYDVSINTTGWVKFITNASIDKKIIVRYAENIKDNELDFESAGGINQIQEDIYISSGKTNQSYSPRFTFHGFRYFEIIGECEEAICQVVHSDIEKIGNFNCSCKTLNWIVEAYKNSQLTNMHSGVPSDCPHRERLGYTGDGQITAEAAMYFFDMKEFYYKWLQDIADSQCKKSGHVQHTAPFSGGGGGPGGWGCAMIILPWKLYQRYKDLDVLSNYYENMERWLDYLYSRSEDYIIMREETGGWCLGDWCTPYNKIEISEKYVNTYYYGLCTNIMIDISKLLKRKEETQKYMTLLDKIKTSFKRHFYNTELKQFDKGIQGASAFASHLGVACSDDVKIMAKYYNELEHFDTGILGTPLLCEVLAEHGYIDIAMKLLQAQDFPSYGYWMNNGATTLWEHWNGDCSHNHPMFGSVTSFMMKYIAGINFDENEIFIKPFFPISLQYAKGNTQTNDGEYKVFWIRENNNIKINIETPKKTKTRLIIGEKEIFIDGGEFDFVIGSY